MSQDLAAPADETKVEIPENGVEPTREELSVLSLTESIGVRLARRMNFGGWKTFWTFWQRHIGSLWIYLATYNLMNVFGIDKVENTDPDRPILLVANHRSFFDMYTVSSVLFRRTKRPITLYFPVRGKFFYDSPVGWFVNLVMGWWAMYPPFFREKKEGKKRAFDKFSVRELIRICSVGRGHVIGFHPEGKRNPSEDPYDLLPAQPGIGKVIYQAKPQVVPVFVTGLINHLPRQIMGNWTGGQKVRIWFGEPVDLTAFYEKRDSLRTHKEIADFLMTRIGSLGEADKAWVAGNMVGRVLKEHGDPPE